MLGKSNTGWDMGWGRAVHVWGVRGSEIHLVVRQTSASPTKVRRLLPRKRTTMAVFEISYESHNTGVRRSSLGRRRNQLCLGIRSLHNMNILHRV